MQNPTLLFPGFHLPTLHRKPRSSQQILANKIEQVKQKTFSQLSECLGKFIPLQLIAKLEKNSINQALKPYFSTLASISSCQRNY